MCGLIQHFLKKHTFLGGRRYNRLLQLGGGLSVSEYQFFDTKPITAQKLQTRLDGITILAVKRSSGETLRFSNDLDPIKPDDTLIIFGPDTTQDAFGTLD